MKCPKCDAEMENMGEYIIDGISGKITYTVWKCLECGWKVTTS